MALRKFKMLIEIGQPFPEKSQKHEFIDHKSGMEFNATIWSYEIIGWETSGKIGVYIRVSAWIDEVVKHGLRAVKLKVAE